MKILMITDVLTCGGKERQLVELLKGILAHGNIKVDLVIMSTRRIEFDEIYKLDISIHIIERKLKKDLSVFKKLYRICKNLQPDIIQSWESMVSIYTAPIAKIIGAKFVNFMIQDAPIKLSIGSVTWFGALLTFPLSDVVVGNSIAGLKSYNISQKKRCCIYNGFDLNRTKFLESDAVVRERFNIKSKFVIGMVASVSKFKDYPTFIRAAIEILLNRFDVSFMVIGDGSELSVIKNMVPKEFRSRIIFTGFQKDIESIVNIFSIGVLTTFTEGISNSIIEYMYLGKPVLATDGGGTKELLMDGETGFLLRQGSHEDLVRKIYILLGNYKLRKQMGKAGKIRIIDDFNLNKMTKKFLKLYQYLLKNDS